MPRTTVFRFETRRGPRPQDRPGLLPLLLGGWFGGVALAGLALAADLGWLAALLAYSLGGSTVLVAFALRAAAGDRPARQQLRPAFARPGRS